MSDLYFDIKGNSMSPTYKDGDKICLESMSPNQKVEVDDLVVFMHPFKKKCKIIKRVAHIKNETKLFVEGDNPDITSTEDSHNFGYIDSHKLIAIKREFKSC
jgi:nickel-type superoxide dismutase maturation protease|tara:strand:- start:716 stop:1021 length:306 start_codon:yes stop_codon:yes gene_type:complete